LGEGVRAAILFCQVIRPETPLPVPASPEARLILCCAALAHDDEREALARELVAEVDFDLLGRLAKRHAVTPTVYRFLERACAEQMPQAGAAALRTRLQIVVLFNRHLAAELVRIVRLFAEIGIETLSFKGPILAATAYESIEGRQYGDLDLLIRRRDLPRAAELLRAQGYSSNVQRCDRLGDPYFQEFEEFFTAPAGIGGVDLHWQMTPKSFPFVPDEEATWARAQEVELFDAPIRTLDPIDNLLYLCVHGAKHGWHSLNTICDVAALLRALPGLDLEAALDRATRCGSQRMLLAGLYLAHAMLGAELPGELLARAVYDDRIVSLCAKVARDLFRGDPDVDPLVDPWLVPLRSIELPAARARYVVGRLLAPTMGDYQALPLPDALFPLYWLTRPFRMAAQYGPRLVRGAFGIHTGEEAGSR